jgi:3-oxo-5alpha-steroid 4-dehydrogenase
MVGVSLGATGLLAGCTPKTDTTNGSGNSGAAISAEGITWSKEADVVVVGLGGAGGAAAIDAAGAGAKVIVLEKADAGGGSTIANGGFIMLGGTALQKELNIEDSTEEFAKYLVAAAGGTGNEEAWRFMAQGAPALYNWCLEIGMTFDKEVDLGKVGAGRPGLGLSYSGNERAREFASIAKPAPRGHIPSPEGNGQGFFRPLLAKVEELGCEILYNTTGEHLVVNADGRVVGVKAKDSSGEIYIKASRGVCLTAGGFGLNEEMMKAHYVHDVMPAYPTATENELGIGIKMGLEVGADTNGMSRHALGSALYGAGVEALKCMLVNASGRRIVAEDEYYAFVGRRIIENRVAFLIADDALNATLAEQRADKPLASAGSIAELAAAIQVPAEILQASLDIYNAGAAKGEDVEFGKHEEFLMPLATPPYHAYYNGPETCYFHTCGGLKINLDAQVIDLQGNPILGLYAAGRNSNIAYGYYVGSGSSMLDVLTFGRIAGQKAAAETPIA